MTKPVEIRNLSIGTGLPKICVPLTSETAEALSEEAEEARRAQPDLVEWRADFYRGICSEDKLKEGMESVCAALRGIPLIFTVRTAREGGNLDISPDAYSRLLTAAAETGKADLIDVEYFGDEELKKRLIADLQAKGAGVIASSHDFAKTDSREVLLERFQEMDRSGADILKMAVMPKTQDDVAAVMEVTHKMVSECTDRPVISMSMGSMGERSRVEGEQFGSAVTFGTVGAASAPGQIPVSDLRRRMEELHRARVRQIMRSTADTEIKQSHMLSKHYEKF